MYVERLEIENIGPIPALDLNFPFHEGGNPKPIVIVGKNGTGKSILLAQIVNTLLAARQVFYSETEVTVGKVYKLRAPQYITTGKEFSFSKVKFGGGIECNEWVLARTRKEHEETFKSSSIRKEWSRVPETENSYLENNFQEKKAELKAFTENNCALYFPANRFEEPAWLNEGNLLSKPEFIDRTKIADETNRRMICHSPLKINQNWFYDVMLDRELYERRMAQLPVTPPGVNVSIPMQVFAGYRGVATDVVIASQKVLRVILRETADVRFGIGDRKDRRLGIKKSFNLFICGSWIFKESPF